MNWKEWKVGAGRVILLEFGVEVLGVRRWCVTQLSRLVTTNTIDDVPDHVSSTLDTSGIPKIGKWIYRLFGEWITSGHVASANTNRW